LQVLKIEERKKDGMYVLLTDNTSHASQLFGVEAKDSASSQK
jgi:hypothetical protein